MDRFPNSFTARIWGIYDFQKLVKNIWDNLVKCAKGTWVIDCIDRVVRSILVFYNVLTTSINNTHIKRKNSKTIAVRKQFPRESSEARPILQPLGVIYAI
jgi:hypothetical protein